MSNIVKNGSIIALVAVIIFILSYNSIWIIDCITYQYSFATGEKIRSIGDIFESQYVHYFSWNGRYVAHWLCQLFLALLGKEIFSIVNGLMYVALILLVIRLTSSGAVTTSRVTTATCLVLLFCDTEYIPPCQIGYIWMAVFALAFLLLFFNYSEFKSHSAWNYLWLLPFSIIAGNGQEAINIGIGAALIIHVLMNIRRMTVCQWTMFAGFGIGGLFLCLSPATIGRTAEMVTSPLYSILNFFLTLRVTYIFVTVLIYNLLRHRLTLKGFYRENTIFINAIIVLILFNCMIGVGGNRQLFGIELFSCILTIRLLKEQSFSKIFMVIFSLAIAGLYVLKLLEIKKSERVYREVYEKISTNPDGPIYIDFPRFNPFMHAATVFRYGVYLDYALSSIRHEQARHEVDGNMIPCYPEKVDGLFGEKTGNRSFEYLPGEFIVMQDKNNPGKFTLHRSVGIFGMKITLPPCDLDFDPRSHLNTEEYNIMYLPEIMPLVSNDFITID